MTSPTLVVSFSFKVVGIDETIEIIFIRSIDFLNYQLYYPYKKVYRLIPTADSCLRSIAVRLFIFWSIHYLSLNTQKEYRAGTLFY